MIEEIGMLGENCEAKEGGYSQDVIQKTVQYLRDNWKSMDDITPRVAIKIADMIDTYPEDWIIYVEYAK